MLRINSIKDNDWPSIRSAIQQLSKNVLGPDASPQFTGLTLSGLTGSRMLYGDASGTLTSIADLTTWIAASGGLTSADDGDGTLTVGTTGVLEDLNTLGAAASDGQFIVATGAGAFTYESGDTARHSLGLGTVDSPAFVTVDLTGVTDGNIPYMSATGFANSPLAYDATNSALTYTVNKIGTIQGSYNHIVGSAFAAKTGYTYCNAVGLNIADVATGNVYYNNLVGATLASSTTGGVYRNNLVGSTLASSATGSVSYNNLVGYLLASSATGSVSYNNLVGSTLASSATGSITYNNMVGYLLASSTTGDVYRNNMVGSTLASSATGSVIHNNMVGYSLASSATGSVYRNNMVGSTLASSATGNVYYNNLVGYLLASSATGSVTNTYLCGSELALVTGSIDSVFASGYRCLYGITNETNLQSVFAAPYESLRGSSAADLDYAIALGYRAGYNNAYNNPCVIGANATATADKQVVLGSSYYTGGMRLDVSNVYIPTDGWLYIGAGNDARMGYNDTNLVLSPRIVGTGGVVIGEGEAGVDYKFMMHGENATLTCTWMEDEAYLNIDSDVRLSGLQVRAFPTDKKWVIFGDSISDSLSVDYPKYVIDILNLSDTVTNAVGGHTASDQLTVLDGLLAGDATYLDDYDILTLMVGVNDYLDDVPIGTRSDSTATATFAGYMKDFIETALTANPELEIYILTPMEADYAGIPYNTANTAGWSLRDLSVLIANICSDYSIQCIDLYSLSGFNEITIPTYTSDQLHPNAAGGAVIGKIVAEAFANKSSAGKMADFSTPILDDVGIGIIAEEKLHVDGTIRMERVETSAAPTVAVLAEAGNLNGNYRYRISYVCDYGETEVSGYSDQVAPANEKVTVTLPVGTDDHITGRKVWRTVAGAGFPYETKLVATVANNTATSYIDNIADGSLGVFNTAVNTTAQHKINSSVLFDSSSLVSFFGIGSDQTKFLSSAFGAYCGFEGTGEIFTGIGYGCGYDNSGAVFTGSGYYCGHTNTGHFFSGVGGYCGYENTGVYFTGAGYGSGYQNTGGTVTASGAYSVQFNSGDYVNALGYEAGKSNSGDNCVFLGDGAGNSNATSNQFILKHVQAHATALLQGDFTNRWLHLPLDSDKLYVGTGKDGYLEYDGTNLNINPRNVGSGSLKVNGDIWPATDDTYYLGKNDDDTPFAWKGVILKDTTDGKYYRYESVNGVLTAVDLTD